MGISMKLIIPDRISNDGVFISVDVYPIGTVLQHKFTKIYWIVYDIDNELIWHKIRKMENGNYEDDEIYSNDIDLFFDTILDFEV